MISNNYGPPYLDIYWYDLQLVPLSANEPIDIPFADERDLSENEIRDFPTELPSLLVFSSEIGDYGGFRAQWSRLAGYMAILHRPCGPRKLYDSDHVSTLSGSQNKPRVLVVDGNSINLHLMVTFMNKRKVVVLDKAENGRAAVDAVERMLRGYDLIFMDMSMPIMDGFEATRAIRAI